MKDGRQRQTNCAATGDQVRQPAKENGSEQTKSEAQPQEMILVFLSATIAITLWEQLPF
jgi:hypothetical protein